MMSDTAGFQKVLEMSKREEEDRLKKLKTQTEQDLENAVADSLNQAHTKGKHEQAIIDAEEAQLQAALAMSEAASKIGQKAESEEEKQFKYILEQSKAQADKEAALMAKNEELLKIMAQMEEEKQNA